MTKRPILLLLAGGIFLVLGAPSVINVAEMAARGGIVPSGTDSGFVFELGLVAVFGIGIAVILAGARSLGRTGDQ